MDGIITDCLSKWGDSVIVSNRHFKLLSSLKQEKGSTALLRSAGMYLDQKQNETKLTSKRSRLWDKKETLRYGLSK